MDSGRGLAALLVILTHAVVMVDLAPTIELSQSVRWLDTVLAPIRMPLMMLLSGMLLDHSLRKPPRVFVAGKLRRIVYPFLVWTMLFVAFHMVWAPLQNERWDVPAWTDLVLPGLDHLWFLQHLAVYYGVAFALQQVPRWIPLVAALLFTSQAQDDLTARFWLLMAYFLLGSIASRHRGALRRMLASRLTITAATLCVPVIFWLADSGVNIRYSAPAAPLTVGAMLAAIKMLTLLESTPFSGVLEFIGRHSIVYYLGHWIPVIVTADLVARVSSSSWAVVAATLGVAVLVCTLLVRFERRHPIGAALFTFRPPAPSPSARWLLSPSDRRPS